MRRANLERRSHPAFVGLNLFFLGGTGLTVGSATMQAHTARFAKHVLQPFNAMQQGPACTNRPSHKPSQSHADQKAAAARSAWPIFLKKATFSSAEQGEFLVCGKYCSRDSGTLSYNSPTLCPSCLGLQLGLVPLLFWKHPTPASNCRMPALVHRASCKQGKHCRCVCSEHCRRSEGQPLQECSEDPRQAYSFSVLLLEAITNPLWEPSEVHSA